MKTFEILVRAYTTVVVTAENEEDALEIAGTDTDISEPNGWEIEDWVVDRELTNIDNIKRAISYSPWHEYEKRSSPYI